MVFGSMAAMVGNTPLVEFKTRASGRARILVKLESYNPTGSIKDRACLNHIELARKAGQLEKGKVILDASSGNMACSLAYFGRIMGYPVRVICNTKLTEDKRNFIRFFGGELEVFGDLTVEGNRKCRDLAKEDAKYCFLDQLHNPGNPQASYETLGPEILRDVPGAAAVIGSMGSGGSMCGVGRYMREKSPTTKVLTVQAASGTKIPGTGALDDGEYVTPFIDELINRPLHHDTFKVHLNEAGQRTRELADQGIFTGLQGGGVLHGALEAIKKHDIAGDVVMIIGDSGWKNMDKLQQLIA